MATTTNNGWTTPNNSDPFKDGALAIRTLGNGIDTSVGTGLLAWTAYTPTLGNIALGSSGTSSFRYAKLGKNVFVRGTITINGTGGNITGQASITLPLTAATGYAFLNPIGQVFYWNGGTAFPGIIWCTGTTSAVLGAFNASGTYLTYQELSTSIPFAWTSGTRAIYIQFSYEAA
jgi:hypothetical protein